MFGLAKKKMCCMQDFQQACNSVYVGESETLANVSKTTPCKLEHLVGTLLRLGFDPGKLRLQTGMPPELVQLVETSKPITELGLG